MFEVMYRIDGKIVLRVVESARLAQVIARGLARQGYRVIVRRVRVDVYLMDPETLNLLPIAKGVDVAGGIEWAGDWVKADQSAGCVLWPSRVPMPTRWGVAS